MAVRSQSGSKPLSESGFLPPHSRQNWALGPNGGRCGLLSPPPAPASECGIGGSRSTLGHFLLFPFGPDAPGVRKQEVGQPPLSLFVLAVLLSLLALLASLARSDEGQCPLGSSLSPPYPLFILLK